MTAKPFAEHPAVKYIESGIANFKARTGKSIEEWVQVVKDAAPSDRKARIN